jgi:hypothetical protein
LNDEYGKITEHHGNEHDYLGMVLTYEPEEKKIILNMRSYTKAMIDEFEQGNENDIIKNVKTPATSNLFKTRNETEASYLSATRSSCFHSMTAKLLFLAKRGRPDILLAVSL